jgi:hypothetical protein
LPILQELASYGIDFKEETHEIFPNV